MKKIVVKKEAIYSGKLLLVNREYPILCDCREEEPDTVCYPGTEAGLDKEVLDKLLEAVRAVDGGQDIILVSGYRSREWQAQIYMDTLKEKGIGFTRRYVALPGCSEHETGLAADLGLNREPVDFITPAFPDDGICGLFKERAAEFGFILRYPAEKEGLTGISHEPWHFRYVGCPHAAIIKERGLCLEEYIDMLKEYPYPEKPLVFNTEEKTVYTGYCRAAGEITEIQAEEDREVIISGNNIDGFIITAWPEG